MKGPTSQQITAQEQDDGPKAARLAPEYTLEYLAACTDTDVQAFLRESSPNDLSCILYVASDALRDRLFANLSSAAQLEILDKMLCSPPESEEEVKDAVKVSVHTLAKLEAKGTVKVPREATGLSTPRVFQPGPIRPEDLPRQIQEYDLAGAILGLRASIRSLPPGKLRSVIQQVSNRDLTILVCAPPFDRDLMEFIGRGLSERAAEMFREDCEKWAGDEPLHYLEALRTLNRSITMAHESIPTEEEYARLKDLALRLWAYKDDEFRHVVKEHLSNEQLICPLLVLGGLNGPWAKRLQPLLSDKAWKLIQEDFEIITGLSYASSELFDRMFSLPSQLQEAGYPLPDPAKEPLSVKSSWFGKLFGLFSSKANSRKEAKAYPAAEYVEEPQSGTKHFSLFSALRQDFAEFWIPLHREICEGTKFEQMDWMQVANRCAPCTARLLKNASGWRTPEDIQRDVSMARSETLPQWKEHIRLAAMLGDAILLGTDAQSFAATLAKLSRGEVGVDGLMEHAQVRLAAYDEKLPISDDTTSFWKELGVESVGSLFKDSGKSKAPFVLSPCAPVADQLVTALAVRMACHREGFLFVEEVARTSGDSAITFVAEVITATSGSDREHLAQAYALKLRQVEENFELLENVLCLLMEPKKLKGLQQLLDAASRWRI